MVSREEDRFLMNKRILLDSNECSSVAIAGYCKRKLFYFFAIHKIHLKGAKRLLILECNGN